MNRVEWNRELCFMQDNAPPHAARETIDEFAERGIHPIFWPAYSPDLNPIETVWNSMKDWLQAYHPERRASYDQLRENVIEAWEAIGATELMNTLIDSMPDRCADVISAEGGYTKW